VQFLKGSRQDAERGPEQSDRLTGLQDPREGVGHGQILEMADVQLLVQVGGKALQHNGLGGRGWQRRQLVAGFGEVVIVEAVLDFVVVAWGQVSEETPWNRSLFLRRAVEAYREASSWVVPFTR
jgi:hypothetical protein